MGRSKSNRMNRSNPNKNTHLSWKEDAKKLCDQVIEDG